MKNSNALHGVLAVALVASFLTSNPADAERIKWHSLKDGLEIAATTNKKILIDFNADWCIWCKRMESTWANPLVEQYVTENFVLVKATPDKNRLDKAYFEQFGLKAYPTTCLYDPATRTEKHIGGFHTPDDFKARIEGLLNGRDLSPENIAAVDKLIKSGNVYLQDHQYTRALQDFEQAMSINKDANACNNAGNAYRALGHYERAVRCYDQALESKGPAPAMYYRNRATCKLELNDFEGALADVSSSMSSVSGLSLTPCLCVKALIFALQGKSDQATSAATDAKLLFSKCNDANKEIMAWALIYLARSQRQLGDSKGALQTLATMSEYGSKLVSSDQAQMKALRGTIESAQGQKSLADTDLTDALKIDPDNSLVRKWTTSEIKPIATMVVEPAPSNSPAANVSPSLNSPIQDKWALVVGLSSFAHSDYNLKYADKDATDFKDFLVSDCHFAPDHIKVMLNEHATRKNIMSAFGDNWLPRVAMPGDLVVIYISTHGTPNSKDVGKQNYIVAYDTDRNELFGSAVNMNDLCDQIKNRVPTDRVLMVLDTCYSGNAMPGARGGEAGANFDAATIAQGCGRLVISSSSPNERSWESPDYANGIFTHNLIKGLKKQGDVLTAFDEVKKNVRWEVQSNYGVEQTPTLGGNWEGVKLLLNVPPAAPRCVPERLRRSNITQGK